MGFSLNKECGGGCVEGVIDDGNDDDGNDDGGGGRIDVDEEVWIELTGKLRFLRWRGLEIKIIKS